VSRDRRTNGGLCELGDETSDSIQCGEFCDWGECAFRTRTLMNGHGWLVGWLVGRSVGRSVTTVPVLLKLLPVGYHHTTDCCVTYNVTV
jgi:hypothetical protein